MCFIYITIFIVVTVAYSGKISTVRRHRHRRGKLSPQQPSLHTKLQNCFTPTSILENICVLLTPKVDPSGALAALVLIRLSKQLIALDNNKECNYIVDSDDNNVRLWNKGLENLVPCLTSSNWTASPRSLELVVEGIKAASVISRLLPNCLVINDNDDEQIRNINDNIHHLLEKLHDEDEQLIHMIQPHQLSGLKWSIDCIHLSTKDRDLSHQSLPLGLQMAYDNLQLPFLVRPGFLMEKFSATTSLSSRHVNGNHDEHNLFTIASFVEEVDFQVDKIKTTTTNRVVTERRQTAWLGDEHVGNFDYSKKSMRRLPWSEVVANVRDRLHNETSHYYDGCLLNFYPDGDSAMRYHIDPEQGERWDYETAVVSIGATRRFAFRSIIDDNSGGSGDRTSNGRKGLVAGDSKPHMFVLMNGDVVEMFNDCQERFQHTVKTSELKGESAPRVSLVFKKTLEG